MDDTTEAQPVKRRGSVLWTVIGAVIVVIATILYIAAVMYKPAYGSNATANAAVHCVGTGPGACTVHLQIQQQVGRGPNAAWLGYQTDVPGNAEQAPGTLFTLPRNSLVTMTIRNYDSQTNPRNEFFSLVQGTVGGVEYVNGKTVKIMDPSIMSHTFTIPDFGVSVPMMGIPSNASANAFETMRFTFRTPDRTGVFRWQCIVPCGSGLYGNGGPMGELGYMQGLITLT